MSHGLTLPWVMLSDFDFCVKTVGTQIRRIRLDRNVRSIDMLTPRGAKIMYMTIIMSRDLLHSWCVVSAMLHRLYS